MLTMATKSRSLLSVLRREAWGLPEIEGPDIKAARPIAEEAIPGQRLSNFYPAYLGEVIQDRYQLVCKLGCGRKCTVWLARVIKG